MSEPMFNKLAEAAVVGSVLQFPGGAAEVFERVALDDIYWQPYKVIYRAMVELFGSGVEITEAGISDKLREMGAYDDENYLRVICELQDLAATGESLRTQCAMVCDYANKRRLSSFGLNSHKRLQASEVDVEQLVAEWDGVFAGVAVAAQPAFYTWSSLIPKFQAELDARRKNPHGVVGLSSGFADIDRLTGGMHPGELVVVAGWTTRGKSSFCEQIGVHVASNGGSVCYFTPEMTAMDLIFRSVARECKVGLMRLRTGRVSAEVAEQVKARAEAIKNLPIYIDPDGAPNVNRILARAKAAHKRHEVKLVIVDYLQLVGAGERAQNRHQEVAFIARKLKGLAKDMNIPVLLVSQLNRPKNVSPDVEPKPSLFFLKESGDIENAADVVLLVHRPEFQTAKKKGKDIEPVQLIVAKQRNGPAPIDVGLLFNGPYTRFMDATQHPVGVDEEAEGLDDILPD